MINDYKIIIEDDISKINRNVWNNLVDKDHLQMQYDYLDVVSGNLINQLEYYYLQVQSGEKIIAVCLMFIDYKFDFGNSLIGIYGKIREKFNITVKTLHVYNPLTEYNTFCIDEEYKSCQSEILSIVNKEVEKFAKKKKLKFILWRDYREKLECKRFDKKYIKFYYMPGTIMHLNCDCFDDYMHELSKKQRHNIKNKIKKRNAELDISIVDADTLTEDENKRCHELYMNTLANNNMKYEILAESYLKKCGEKLGKECKMMIARYNGQIVGFAQLLENEDVCINVRMGMDYSVSKELELYYHLLYSNINYSITNLKKHLYLSQTCYRAKLEVGVKIVPLYSYALFRNPVVHFFARKVFRKNFKKFEELSNAENPKDVLKKYEAYKFQSKKVLKEVAE